MENRSEDVTVVAVVGGAYTGTPVVWNCETGPVRAEVSLAGRARLGAVDDCAVQENP